MRLVHPSDRDRGSHDPCRRARARRHRGHGVDVECAVPPAEGALRLPPRKRRGRRPCGVRWAHVVLRRPAHGRAGLTGRSRTWNLARGAGRVGVRSHQRAAAAQDEGRFADEIVTVGDVQADEGVRRDTTLEKLAALQPVFDPEGTTTAGNAPGVNDGASCVVVCSEEFAERRGLEPLARSSPRGTSQTTTHTSRALPHAQVSRRSPRSESRSTTSSVSRSTRRSRPSRRTRRACSAPTSPS